ncbi:hypothetical protein C0992_009816, partial [Termitomyces sp. T32_za158]
KTEEMNKRSKKPLSERLLPGCGALARHGDFWYPVHLIQVHKPQQLWCVRWWRGCAFENAEIVPGSVTEVKFQDIVDSLWQDLSGRRRIRLGKWKHACEVSTAEDILMDPSLIPFSQDVEDALNPAADILRCLFTDPHLVDSEDVPAKAWLEQRKQDLRKSLVPFGGPLAVSKIAQISNWIETHITKDPSLTCRMTWLTQLTNAHARTLYIASCLERNTKNKGFNQRSLLQKAWIIQQDVGPPHSDSVDVELESLGQLEEEMFERGSLRAGVAGHYQWGLDAGDHQGNWDPYAGTPSEWNRGDREGSESELD